MKPSEPFIQDWMDARVEVYLDEALPAGEQARFEHALAADADWEAELFLARQIRDGLHALPQPMCPPRVTDAVLAQVRRQAQVSWIDRLQGWIEQQWLALWQPALAMAVLLLLVVSATLIGRPTPQTTYADAEVDRARQEVQWALAYLSEVGRQTGKMVRDEVIAERVVLTVQDAFNTRQRKSDTTER